MPLFLASLDTHAAILICNLLCKPGFWCIEEGRVVWQGADINRELELAAVHFSCPASNQCRFIPIRVLTTVMVSRESLPLFEVHEYYKLPERTVAV